ncbi:MAG: alkaline phosphatase D family protein [Bryobacteraceae bacterium]
MLTRRDLIRSSAWLALTFPSREAGGLLAAPVFTADPFACGISSGDPTAHGVVLWTRLMADPAREQAWQRARVRVRWEVAADEAMKRIVRRGEWEATPELAHSVHADVEGLAAGRWYWYRFLVDGAESPIGRTRTAPAGGSDRLRFAFASCQHFEQGHYTAYEHMAGEDLDLVLHLGDYIYEGAARPNLVRAHTGGEIVTLSDYRNRYALYRSDARLREAHRLFPWVVTWDDHEVDNNYAADVPEDSQQREAFLERRANAYQAYYEAMPLRRSSMPRGSSMQLYRDVNFGSLARFFVLDTRQYRTDQPCGDGDKPPCAEMTAENQTMLGETQERWLTGGLGASRAKWNVLANQVMMAKVDRDGTDGERYPMDQWSGYDTARVRFMRFLGEREPSNPVVITGDVHSNWVCDLRERFRDKESPVVASEFTGTSISSGGDGVDVPERVAAYLPDNPQIHFHNAQRGYVSCEVTGKQFRADYRVLDRVTAPGSPIRTKASFVLEDGRRGVQRA